MTTNAPTTINGIPLSALLSSCIDACRRGCEVIRSVHVRSLLGEGGGASTARQLAHTFKLSTSHNTIDPATNAVVIDPRSALTEADMAAQEVVLGCLRSLWGEAMRCGDVAAAGCESRPRLWVVGEEDGETCSGGNADAGLFERYCVDSLKEVPLATDLVQVDADADAVVSFHLV